VLKRPRAPQMVRMMPLAMLLLVLNLKLILPLLSIPVLLVRLTLRKELVHLEWDHSLLVVQLSSQGKSLF
jgi:hypothetical protein